MTRRRPAPDDDFDPLKLFHPELLKSEREKKMDNLDRLIGRIEASQEGIKEAMNQQRETLQQHRDESRESRAKIYKEIEGTNAAIADLKSDLKRMADRLDQAETKLSSFEKIRENVKGGAIVLSFIWAAIGAGVVVFWKWIVAKFTGAA